MNGYPPSSQFPLSMAPLNIPKGNRPPLRDLRKLLNEETSSTTKNTPRIVSDPLPRRPTAFSNQLPGRKRATSFAQTEPESLAFSTLVRGRRQRRDSVISSDRPSHIPVVVSPAEPSLEECATPAIPIGTTRPTPFTTFCMPPRSHKTVQGQLTVLPSSSLLVDFREGERRRGNPGTQVFIVSPDGLNIKLFDAPHLSTPCCLAEHISEYSLEALPSSLWKQYNDTAELIDKIKQRTPMLVLHDPRVKCSLMSNEPLADVELVFINHKNENNCDSDSARMRFKLARQSRTLEIARCKTDSRGKEWRKKTFTNLSLEYEIPANDLNNLDEEERDGFEVLGRFLLLCNAREDLYMRNAQESADSGTSFSTPLTPPDTTWRTTIRARILTASNSTLPTLDIPPRPAKLNSSKKLVSSLRANDKENSKRPSDVPPPHTSFLTDRPFTNDSLPTSSCNRSLSTSVPGAVGVGTRFIPSVGWCIRQASQVSQGGRYKIMFVDGAALDVDVDEEWVELRDPSSSGDVMRCGIRDKRLNRAIGNRIQVFQQFVRLFEVEG